MCNCRCNCNCHNFSSEKARLQSIYNELEAKNPGSLLTGKGMYDMMKAQQAREAERERRNRWRR